MSKSKQLTGTNDNLVVWLLFTLIILFFVHRVQYFLMDKFSILRIGTDAIWWWIIQRWYYYSGEGFDSSAIADRINFRLPTDIFYQEGVVYLSKLLGVDLFYTNLTISIILFFGLCIAIFYLAHYVLQSAPWATLFSLCFMFTAYPTFIRYPILTPKMFGFILFPIVVGELLKIVLHNKRYLSGLIILSLFMITYIVSFVYTVGSIFLAIVVAGLYRYYSTRKFHEFVSRQMVFWIVAFIIFLICFYLLTGGVGKFSAPDLKKAELTYTNHQASFYRFGNIIFSGYASLIAVIVGGFLYRRFCENEIQKTMFLYFFTMYLVLMVTSLVGQALASEIPALRVLWLWRASYYAHLPASLCLFIGLRAISTDVSLWRMKYHFVVFGFLIFFSLTSLHAARHFDRLPLMSITWFLEHNAKKESLRNKSLQELIDFTHKLPKSSLILMPNIPYQNADSDIFESYSGVPSFLSRGERPHLIYKTSRTETIAKAIESHSKVWNEQDRLLRSKMMLDFARENNITHILVRRKKDSGLDSRIAFQNKFWTLYSAKN